MKERQRGLNKEFGAPDSLLTGVIERDGRMCWMWILVVDEDSCFHALVLKAECDGF